MYRCKDWEGILRVQFTFQESYRHRRGTIELQLAKWQKEIEAGLLTDLAGVFVDGHGVVGCWWGDGQTATETSTESHWDILHTLLQLQ